MARRVQFSKSEIKQMEKLLAEGKEELSDQSFLQKLTEELNHASNRSGNRAIQMKQVQRWFHKRKIPGIGATTSPSSSEELVNTTDASLSTNAPECSFDMPKVSIPASFGSGLAKTDTYRHQHYRIGHDPANYGFHHTGEKVPELMELEFEAQSNRDGAWYDVDIFLAHRVLSSGEPEVRVRYQGFGAEEDEWVNIKKGVRERSIPLESSECRKVAVGDLVLSFWERSEQAMYFDAHVLEIQRKLHDIRGCRCLFLIKYDHDQTEEKVQLKRLCRRPSRNLSCHRGC